jgi:hypothetical protein
MLILKGPKEIYKRFRSTGVVVSGGGRLKSKSALAALAITTTIVYTYTVTHIKIPTKHSRTPPPPVYQLPSADADTEPYGTEPCKKDYHSPTETSSIQFAYRTGYLHT